MFDLTKFLTENKLTRNSILLENDNAPSFTNKEMKFFDPKQVKWGHDSKGNLIVTYKGYTYPLEVEDQDILEPEDRTGIVYAYTNKLPGVTFELAADFSWDGEGWTTEHILGLDDITRKPVWEIDPESDEIPDEEEFDFDDDELDEKKFPDLTGDGKVTYADVLKGRGVNLNERDLSKREEDLVKKLKKSGKYSKNDPELYRLAAGIMKKQKAMNEVQGEELNKDIALIGGTLKKIETMIDFGRDQDPEVEEGLQTVLNILIDIQHKLETETKDAAGLGGASEFYQMENILKQMGK